MQSRPDTSDPAVDELKRRARRRLVGAVVLALAAAVILPMLLESDPKPLGDDVSIQIPPIDSGKFVNPLSPSPAKGTEPQARSAKSDGKPRTRADAAAAPQPTAAIDAASATELPKVAPPASKMEPGDTRPDVPSATGALVIQLGAFADVKVANDLVAKLKTAGFPAHIEPIAGPQGAMQRVRVGPYASHEAADAALAKLKLAGYDSGVVTSAK